MSDKKVMVHFLMGNHKLTQFINIANQEKHHKKQTFKEEYLEFLEKFKIQFEEKYIFENLK